jgi:hypothetical protein
LNKALLTQALKFKKNIPTNNQIKRLIELANDFQNENELYFLSVKHRQKPQIVDMELFFRFLSQINELEINSFEDIEYYLQKAQTRKESIEKCTNSKAYYAKVFDKVTVFQKQDENPVLYKDIFKIPFDPSKQILAVENGESFLNIYAVMSKFGFEQFVYLGGFPNSLTKEFLKDKDVVFFLDYDIEAIRIYDSLQCEKKEFFKHPDIQSYFENKNYLNKSLYKEQRARLPKEHEQLQWLIELIKKHSGVIEQEIVS